MKRIALAFAALIATMAMARAADLGGLDPLGPTYGGAGGTHVTARRTPVARPARDLRARVDAERSGGFVQPQHRPLDARSYASPDASRDSGGYASDYWEYYRRYYSRHPCGCY